MPFRGIHHVVIRVRNLHESIQHWTQALGMELSETRENTELGVQQAFFNLDGGGFIELIAPLHSDSPINETLETRGEGVHVLSMSVEDSSSAITGLRNRGVVIVGDTHEPQFVHPKSASGVMLGFSQTERG